MKKKFLFHFLALPIAAFLVFTFANCNKKQVPAGAEAEIMQADTTVMYAQKNEIFIILLDAQMGTGFRWMVEGDLPQGLQLVKEEQITPEDQRDLQRFQFQATEKGSYTLLFVYRRPWEKKPLSALQQKAYQVNVQ